MIYMLVPVVVFSHAGNAFACNSSNGVITVSNNIDRETRDMYVLFVEVSILNGFDSFVERGTPSTVHHLFLLQKNSINNLGLN